MYCLFTSTRKRKHIAALPFEARCTASGYGWICVGGEHDGHFAAIKVDGSASQVDDRLDIGGAWTSGSSAGAQGLARRTPSVKVERIGEEIVNSISIHRITDEAAHLDDIVAVLTNNDRTVRVYSLPQGLETSVLDLPHAMNHATVSPDGRRLVAVCDAAQAFFFQREVRDAPPQIPKPHNRLTSASLDWKLTNIVGLHVSKADSSVVGYFTTAWSPSGQLVALGSEGGYITVLDVEVLGDVELEDEEAIVAIIPGSRPDVPPPHPGAVRSMLFSPDPWDLLIWAEDQGRVCIGDLRTGLKRKQVVNLDPKEEGLARIEVEDLPAEDEAAARDLDQLQLDFLRRYRDAEARDAGSYAPEYIESRRRQRQHRHDLAVTRAALEDETQGLTPREQEMLNSLRTTRQREEARSQGGVARGVNYTSADLFGSGSRSSSSGTPNPESRAASTRPSNEPSATWAENFPELARMSAASPRPERSTTASPDEPRLPPIEVPGDASTWNTSSRQTSQETDPTTTTTTTRSPPRQPRRRASIILSPPTTASPSSPSTTRTDPTTNPWRTIEDAMSLARGPLFEPPSTTTTTTTRPSRSDLTTSVAAERAARARTLVTQRSDRWRSLAADNSAPPNAHATGANASRLADSYEAQRRLRATANFGGGGVAMGVGMGMGIGGASALMGVRTAGLAMSGDGATLWAACEEGVFEMRVGRKGRLFWPAVEMV